MAVPWPASTKTSGMVSCGEVLGAIVEIGLGEGFEGRERVVAEAEGFGCGKLGAVVGWVVGWAFGGHRHLVKSRSAESLAGQGIREQRIRVCSYGS